MEEPLSDVETEVLVEMKLSNGLIGNMESCLSICNREYNYSYSMEHAGLSFQSLFYKLRELK